MCATRRRITRFNSRHKDSKHPKTTAGIFWNNRGRTLRIVYWHRRPE